MQKHPLQSTILQLKNALLILVSFGLIYMPYAQNSMVGDGFGGRLWYKPYNYSVGSYSAYTICGDSSQLYGWGDNEYGQLGNGNTIHTSVPVKIIGMTNALYYSTGYIMGAIKKNKTGWVWGSFSGSVPVKVIDKVKFLDAGMSVCTFVKNDGTVWSVGQNSTGSFGNGVLVDSATLIPQKMSGINTAVRVANSGRNNIILLKDGTVMLAGINFSNKNCFIPVKVQGLEKIVDIKANIRTVIALNKEGDVYAWGEGHNGSLGNGGKGSTNIPLKINSLKNIVAISGCNDGEHFLALDSGHNCYAWGYNDFGECGIKDIEIILTPTLVATDVDDIMAGERFSYIVKKSGELWATGMSKGGSIWMNLDNKRRHQFLRISPGTAPMNICKSEHFATKYYKNLNITLCKGDSFKVSNKYYNTAGKFQDTLLKDTCMDTISSIQITFNKVISKNQHVYLCSGEHITVGPHTYFYAGEFSDTLSNYNGCDSAITTTITIFPVSISSHNIEFCEGGRYSIGNHIYYRSGQYMDTFSNYLGCDSIIISRLIVHPLPIADFNFIKQTAFTDETIQFNNLSDNADTYRWQFDTLATAHSEQKSPVYIYLKEGIKNISLIVINSSTGCKDTITKRIAITDNTEVFIPNAFTPNDDQINDYFFPVSRNYDVIRMQIYNKWGELIYETNEFTPGWNGILNGKPCQQDIYMYLIELSNTSTNKHKRFSGSATLLQ